MTITAGQALRESLDAALARVGKKAGATLVWSEHELQSLDAAAAAADRRAGLQKLYDKELAALEPRVTVVIKLAAEIRACEKAIEDRLARVNVGEGAAKSTRHQRAATVRWDRHRERRGLTNGTAS